jgi:hypothetical protein
MGIYVSNSELHGNNANDGEDIQEPPLFAGRIEMVSGTLWSSAVGEYSDMPNDKVILVKWTVNTNNQRITIYTLEKRDDNWERWIRVWRIVDYPTFWDYVYCSKSPDDVELDQYNQDLVCSACYDLE